MSTCLIAIQLPAYPWLTVPTQSTSLCRYYLNMYVPSAQVHHSAEISLRVEGHTFGSSPPMDQQLGTTCGNRYTMLYVHVSQAIAVVFKHAYSNPFSVINTRLIINNMLISIGNFYPPQLRNR